MNVVFTVQHTYVKLFQGCYSSASSRVSTATIRSTNAKETKEKRNREKLLAGPVGSEMSIAAQDIDLEMDYYDYNVINAGAAPGSYLGKTGFKVKFNKILLLCITVHFGTFYVRRN